MQQIVGGNTSKYVLDVALGLSEVLVNNTGANTTRYLHDKRSLQAQHNPDSSWKWNVFDAQGS